ncbi:hypothetical protein [Streptomyces sedi]|uniref:Uncharacterized protein n=1 Tax=Streptomyces sedi TaxID=555059 RepID=A0A5C4UU63_9ACTN|nr:hypothetical protein [Streptomyces sedi]TNM27075.1 hypothetical protein FH715_22240 [Streptomyces sedi]
MTTVDTPHFGGPPADHSRPCQPPRQTFRLPRFTRHIIVVVLVLLLALATAQEFLDAPARTTSELTLALLTTPLLTTTGGLTWWCCTKRGWRHGQA